MRKILSCLLVISSLISKAQNFSLVTNNGGVNKVGSNPSSFVTIGTTTYFTANDGVNGTELWKTDGTLAGTVLVKDINPGTSSSSPFYLTNLNGVLMFAANNGTNGAELWRSDGTNAGTYMVLDVWPGNSSGLSRGEYSDDRGKDNYTPLVIGSTMYFFGTNNTTGKEVWKTDGTAAGTVILKDILASTSYYPASGHFTNIGGVLYFLYRDGTAGGHQLWKSDGTTAGTVKVSVAIVTAMYAAATSSMMFFADISNTLYRVTTTGTVTSEAFITVNGSSLKAVGNSVYVAATKNSFEGEELYTSNGGNFTLVKDINIGNGSSTPASITSVGSIFYFTAFDATNGRELWKSDGTSGGTVLVKDIYSGTRSSLLPGNIELSEYNGSLYFRADDGVNGTEIWKSDGTTLGTSMIKDISTAAYGSYPVNFISTPSGLLFTATDGTTGSELWKTDGSEAGTLLIKDIRVAASDPLDAGLSSSFYSYYSIINNNLYFPGTERLNGNEIWKTSGSTAALVKDILPGNQHSNANNFTDVNGTVFFSATTELGTELWKTDGTSAGTVMVKDIYAGYNSSNPSNFCNVNGVLFFSADNGINGQELWKSDGTAAGTVMVKDIVAGSGTTGLFHFKNLNGTLLFGVNDFTGFGQELWKSDGTAAGTTIVKDMSTSGAGIYAGDAVRPVVMNNVLYYYGETSSTGGELIRSDGTAAGTYVVKDIYPGTTGSSPSYFKVVGNKLFFAATTSSEGTELWVSDGTQAGTQLVKDINSGTANASPTDMAALGDKLVFGASDANGKEVWITDGTDAGTLFLKDIVPGAGTSAPSNFVTVGDRVYFYANDGAGGFDIWRTNGTVAGTVLVSELENNSGSSASYPMYFNGSALYVIANTPVSGFQLWSSSDVLPVKFTKLGINCSPSGALLKWSTVNEVNNDRFEIENSNDAIVWRKIGAIKTLANNANENEYQFKDNERQGEFYRLKQIDKDGRYTYSSVLKLNCNNSDLAIALYPVPAKNVLNVNVAGRINNEVVKLQINDSQGRTLLKQNNSIVVGSNIIEINISSLPSGAYVLKATTLTGVSFKTFIVSK